MCLATHYPHNMSSSWVLDKNVIFSSRIICIHYIWVLYLPLITPKAQAETDPLRELTILLIHTRACICQAFIERIQYRRSTSNWLTPLPRSTLLACVTLCYHLMPTLKTKNILINKLRSSPIPRPPTNNFMLQQFFCLVSWAGLDQRWAVESHYSTTLDLKSIYCHNKMSISISSLLTPAPTKKHL